MPIISAELPPFTPYFVRCTPSSSSCSPMVSLPARPARSAASLTTFANSAPEKPRVTRATWLHRAALSTVRDRGVPRKCTARMAARPSTSGSGTTTFRDRRPGRVRAGSRTSGRFVAASRSTPVRGSNPSSSVSSWFKVWSRSSFMPSPLLPPTASSSSMNTTQGAFLRASAKRSLMRAAPRPTNSSTNSLADAAKNGTPASPATALASSVLPVPGEPHSSTPEGMWALRRA
mmetsp:Transcript_1145/g.3452  ORF Transcript_1145/g.3452 Transcript_1145/m.3452 type:complete len:232 (+) Transcript_1145:1104-1799(+)